MHDPFQLAVKIEFVILKMSPSKNFEDHVMRKRVTQATGDEIDLRETRRIAG